jgi:DNA-binding response OmpR family regulator
MARVLVVDDDSLDRAALIRDLADAGHAVRSSDSALSALREVAADPPDVVILKADLPDLDSAQTVTMMRAVCDAPVLVSSPRSEESEVTRLLGVGADDYLVRPYSPAHLLARVTALLRRARRGSGGGHTTVSGGLRLDARRRLASLEGRELTLTRREFDLLAYLAARPGEVITRRELLAEVWHQSYGDDQTIDVHLSWLRRKLGESAAEPRYLHTVRGVGVRLEPPAIDGISHPVEP